MPRCLGAQPSCHDEHVIYQVDSAGSHVAFVHGWRVAASDTVDMGDLTCNRVRLPITCTISVGTWRFWLDGKQLAGTLTRADRTVMRQVTAHRAPAN